MLHLTAFIFHIKSREHVATPFSGGRPISAGYNRQVVPGTSSQFWWLEITWWS